jgi:uncharacterized protein YegP (UPF0339 family)
VTEYQFEIVKRAKGRFSWVFFEADGGRRRVLARADRDYRNKKRAKKAICTLRDQASGAELLPGKCSSDDTDLPPTYFELTPPSTPLPVGRATKQRAYAKGRRRKSKTRARRQDSRALQTQESAALVPHSSSAVVTRTATDLDTPPATEKGAPRTSATAARRRAAKKAASGSPPTQARRTR